MREALTWTGVWVTLSLLLGLGIYTGWIGSYAADERHTAALEFLTALPHRGLAQYRQRLCLRAAL